MPTTHLDQLKRDAAKPGAYQAILALAEYALELQIDLSVNVLHFLLRIDITAPKEYQDHANLLQGKYYILNGHHDDDYKLAERPLEKIASDSVHYKQAIMILSSICKDPVKRQYYWETYRSLPDAETREVELPEHSAEYDYKNLRDTITILTTLERRDEVAEEYLKIYKDKLNNILKHRELTDTLASKVYYQLFLTHLALATYCRDDKKCIQQISVAIALTNGAFNSPTLTHMKKAIKAREIICLLEDYISNRAPDSESTVAYGLFRFIQQYHQYFRSSRHQDRQLTDQKITTVTVPAQANRTSYMRIRELHEHNMVVFIQNLEGQTDTYSIHEDSTVRSLKNQYFWKTGDSPMQNRFIFSGCQMGDDKKIKEFGVQKEATIHSCRRLLGD